MLPRLKEYPRGCGVQRAFSLIEQQNALQRVLPMIPATRWSSGTLKVAALSWMKLHYRV